MNGQVRLELVISGNAFEHTISQEVSRLLIRASDHLGRKLRHYMTPHPMRYEFDFDQIPDLILVI